MLAVPWPDIYQVTLRALESAHPRLGVLLAHSGLVLIEGNKGSLNVGRHPASVAAQVDDRAPRPFLRDKRIHLILPPPLSVWPILWPA